MTFAAGRTRLLLPLVAGFTLLAAGCETTPAPATRPAAAMMAEGTIINVEEGFLRLRLADGRVEEFMVPADGSVVPIDRLLAATGQRCRVQYRSGVYEDVDGSVSRQFELTGLQFR